MFGDAVRSTRRAFTLIELLIVVAIIAILAAIAVPNFLEAQVRAKVSRAKADMRSLATGLEAYRVDSNRYVPTPCYDRQTGAQLFTLESRWAYLTTPVSYMTSVITDPFGDPSLADSNWQTPAPAGGVKRFKTFDYSAFDSVATSNYERDFFKKDLTLCYGYPDSIMWYMASAGPDRRPGMTVAAVGITPAPASGRCTGLPYDPTNGTVSDGDVVRLGPGGITSGGAGSK
jgi:prepilin-type N-terminal cleavage/methylation domain-containing protein